MKNAKEMILDIAFRLFLEKGYEATSISDIVSQSNLSKGAVYHHFKDKDALHDATIEHFFLRYFSEETKPKTDQCVIDVVESMANGYVSLFTAIADITPDRAAYYRFVFEILPKVRPQLTAHLSNARDALISAAIRDQEKGVLDTRNSPEGIAEHCLALIEGTGMLLALKNEENLNDSFSKMICNLRLSLQVS